MNNIQKFPLNINTCKYIFYDEKTRLWRATDESNKTITEDITYNDLMRRFFGDLWVVKKTNKVTGKVVHYYK